MKPWRKIVIALLAVGFALWALTLWQRTCAFQEFHGGPVHTERALVEPPSAVAIGSRLDAAVRDLQKRHPRLASIEARFLGEPSEHTQALLLTLAQNAYAAKDWNEWTRMLELLGWMAQNERRRARWTVADLENLAALEARLRGLQSQAQVLQRRPPVRVEQLAPEWTSSKAVRHRFLVSERKRHWEDWEFELGAPWNLVIGFAGWSKARRTLAVLNQWHGQVETGTISAPPAGLGLERAYAALRAANAL
jgi:hypothetical protein